ncbi:MAG: YdcF family protein [Ruminococcaceae bacterium]|nr:YdcF family protein [Oscillospiraceae bacterium]
MKTKNKVINLIIRLILILLGIAIILLYIPPLVSLGVINAGNLFGFAVGGGLIILGIFFNKITELIRLGVEAGKGKIIYSCSAVVIALAVIFFSVFFVTLGNVISHSGYTASNENTVIVLGCQIRGSVPSMSLVQRTNAAVKYLEEHPDAIAIATGGQGSDEDLSEGQCIYNLMTEKGISPDRIIIEDKSTSTDENIANAKKIMDEKGLDYNVAIATNEYHEYRASLICKKNGLTASSIPAPSSPRGKPTFFTREVLGVWAQWIKVKS